MPLELIIFVVLGASGKSTDSAAHLSATHVHVSKDLMTNGTPSLSEGFDEGRRIAPLAGAG